MFAAMQSKTFSRCAVVGQRILAIGIVSVLIDYIAVAHMGMDYPSSLRMAGTTCSSMFILCGLGILYHVRWGYYLMLVALHFMLCCPRMRPHIRNLIDDVFTSQVKRCFDRNWLLFSWKPGR